MRSATLRRGLRATLIVAAATATVGAGTWSAFTATTDNASNGFTAGDVTIGDNDAGNVLVSLAGARPGDATAGCIRVTYSGSLDAGVRLLATTSGALASSLDVTVTRGTDASPAFSSCSSFVADTTQYVAGQANGVVYSGLLSAFPAAGVADAPGADETWTTNEARSYRVVVSLRDDAAAAGRSATTSFAWEARNQ